MHRELASLDELLDHANRTNATVRWGRVMVQSMWWVAFKPRARGWEQAVGCTIDEAAERLLLSVRADGVEDASLSLDES